MQRRVLENVHTVSYIETYVATAETRWTLADDASNGRRNRNKKGADEEEKCFTH
jgi:hypothetical protein